jgi:hypothetical protein
MDEEERQKLRDREIKQTIPVDTLKYILGDERIALYLPIDFGKYGQMRRVFLDNKDGGRVLRHWVKPHHGEDEQVYSYRLKDVFNINEEWSGDFGSHVDVYGSTSGGYVGWGGSGVGSIGGTTESHFVQHYKRLKVTVSFKGADGNIHQDIIANDIADAANEQYARQFWYTVKKRCGLISATPAETVKSEMPKKTVEPEAKPVEHQKTEPSMPAKFAFCPNCGEKLPDVNAKFCPFCGALLKD